MVEAGTHVTLVRFSRPNYWRTARNAGKILKCDNLTKCTNLFVVAGNAHIFIWRWFCHTPGWLDRHPGGSEVVLLMAGRDATEAFNSYHPFTDKPLKVSKRGGRPFCYKIVRIKQTNNVSWSHPFHEASYLSAGGEKTVRPVAWSCN